MNNYDTQDSITLPAYAKINLTLDVLARRDDGYHEIQSIMQTITLHDTVTVTRIAESRDIKLIVYGTEAEGVPTNESNIVHRAAAAMQQQALRQGASERQTGLQIDLVKSIPSQAGLGGGSSDAAATLIALNLLFGLNLSNRELTQITAKLGADVPFFLSGGMALVEGLGERVTLLPALESVWPLVIVKPPVGVSTAKAYADLDAATDRPIGSATNAWLSSSPAEVLSNDFETVILAQSAEIAAVSALMQAAPERHPLFQPLLCGSGSALFCRTINQEQAAQLAERLRTLGIGKAWTAETINGSV